MSVALNVMARVVQRMFPGYTQLLTSQHESTKIMGKHMVNTIDISTLLRLLVVVLLGTMASPVLAADEDDESAPRLTAEQAEERVEQILQTPLSDKGADTCLKCH